MKTKYNLFGKTGRLFSILLALLASTTLYANSELIEEDERWQLTLDKKGVKVYTRDYEGSDIEAFKAVTTINAPINNVMSVMANPQSCTEWVHGCTVSYGFDAENFNKRHAYSVNDLPWPVQDRDYVLQINTTSDPVTKQIMMEMHAVAGKKPVDDSYVRTTIAQTYYIFTATEDDKTHMVWLQHTEPGGVLPSWLVNNLLVDIPYKSLKTLEAVAQQEQYQNGSITYDDKGVITGVEKR